MTSTARRRPLPFSRGERSIWWVSCPTGSLLSFAAATDQQWIVILAACGFQCFTVCSWNAIDVLSTEAFAMARKSTGVGLCAAAGRLGAGVAQLCNAQLGTTGMLVTAATMLLVGAVAPVFLANANVHEYQHPGVEGLPQEVAEDTEEGYQLTQSTRGTRKSSALS